MKSLIAMGQGEKIPRATGGRQTSRQREAGEVTRRETRRRVLAAARLEFAERGYVAATVVRIAERAGVSLQSLYSSWGSKRALLRAMMETAVTGQDEPDARVDAGQVPISFAGVNQFGVAAVTDAAAFLDYLVHQFRLLVERAAVPLQNYREAAVVDPEAAADWDQLMEIRRANLAVALARLPASALREGLTPAAAVDTAWVIASPDSHEMLVRRSGYTYDAYEAWVRATLGAALLRS